MWPGLSLLAILGQATPTTVPQSNPDPSGADTVGSFLYQGLAVIAGIVTIILAVDAYRTRRSTRRRDEVLDQLVAEAEDTERAEQLRSEVDRLRAFVEEVPRQARLISLHDRHHALEEIIGRTYEEYRTVESDIIKAGDSPTPELSETVRALVEDSIRPRYLAAQRQQFRDRMLAVLAVILVLLPYEWSPSRWASIYVDVLTGYDGYPPVALMEVALVGGLVVGLVAYGLCWLILGSDPPGSDWGGWWLTVLLAVIGLILSGLAVLWRADLTDGFGYYDTPDDPLGAVIAVAATASIAWSTARVVTRAVGVSRSRLRRTSHRTHPMSKSA
jgi:hypothetical protein